MIVYVAVHLYNTLVVLAVRGCATIVYSGLADYFSVPTGLATAVNVLITDESVRRHVIR